MTHTSVSKKAAGIKSNEVKRISNAPTPFEELPWCLWHQRKYEGV